MTAVPNLGFDVANHRYLDGTRVLPGTTTILRETRFYPDYRSIEPKYRQLGSATHQACHLFGTRTEPGAPFHGDVQARVNHYAKFEDDTGFRGKAWEICLIDQLRGYGGTMDTLGVVPSNEIWMVDIKTGTVPIVGVSMQLAGYDDLFMNGTVVPVCWHPALPPVDLDWIDWVRKAVLEKRVRIQRKSLNLTSEKYTLRSHNEPRWTGDWRSALRVYSNWKEHGLIS